MVREMMNKAIVVQLAGNCHCELRDHRGRELARVHIESAGEIAPEKDRWPELNSFFGQGERWRWQAEPQPGLSGEFWLSVPELQDFVLIGGELENTGSQPVYVDDLCLCEMVISRDDIEASRLFVNGGCQFNSGSASLKDEGAYQHHCSSICAFQGTSSSDCLGLGSISMRRAEVLIEQKLAGDGLHLRPVIVYDHVRLDPGQKLRLETLLINTDPKGAIYCLENWVDAAATVIQPRFNRSLRGMYNTWYAYWTPTSDHGTAELMLHAARELIESGLIHYGISCTSLGVWHNRAAFGEHQFWPGILQGHTFPELAEELAKRGIQVCHGGFWGSVSECATVFREHPEWMAKDRDGNPRQVADKSWGACPHPVYDLDLSIPEALAWLKEHSADKLACWGCEHYWLDFYGFRGRRKDGAVVTDETVCLPLEMERKQLEMIRESLGEGVRIGTYTSPTNRLVGLVDHVRMGPDSGCIDPSPNAPELTDGGTGPVIADEDRDRRWGWVKDCARIMAAAYFYHDKFWINDPDPIMVGRFDNPDTLEEARVRMMVCANSGGFPTVGEPLSHMDASRLALLKKALPVYGQAARVIDLMESDDPALHHLHVDHPAGDWEVLTLFNWDDAPQEHRVDLDRLGLPGAYQAFEFWTQEYVGLVSHELRFTVPSRACRVLRLTPVVDRPQVIGTDRHVAVGVQELPVVQWDRANNTLSGRAMRPETESGIITILLPDGWIVASVGGAEPDPAGQLARVHVNFAPAGQVWAVRFERKGDAIC